MSEDFDREAEKKRLREKLEDDQESRKATEHMSDLLLKGATMTNHHCDTCGDPIFRYDGQEFCPTCGETVENDSSMSDSAENVETDDGGEGDNDVTDGDNDTPERDDDGTGAKGRIAAGEPGDNGGLSDVEPSPARHEGAAGESERATGAGASPAPSSGGSAERNGRRAPETSRSERPSGGDLGEARASLVRTLSDLTARAEATEDPRRARDLLAAAREAAETLAAVDRRDR